MASNQLIAEIARLVGMQNAIVLCRRYGGRTLNIPTVGSITDRHPLTLTVGLAPAEALAKHYGGTQISLPNEINALIEVRNEEIVKRFLGPGGKAEDGDSIYLLAMDFGLHRSYIAKLIDRAGHNQLRISRSMTYKRASGKTSLIE